MAQRKPEAVSMLAGLDASVELTGAVGGGSKCKTPCSQDELQFGPGIRREVAREVADTLWI